MNKEEILALIRLLDTESDGNIQSLGDKFRLRIALNLLSIIRKIHMRDGRSQHDLFKQAEKIGIHILEPHFYSPLPTISQLPDETWSTKWDAGIDWNEKAGVDILTQLARYSNEYRSWISSEQDFNNQTLFGNYDSATYYAMIRHYMPSKIIEVGAGYSTKVSSSAISENKRGEIVAIEPFPRPFLKKLTGLKQLIEKPVQLVPLEVFQQLGQNDILFIDSSHISKVGSDVNYLFLYVLPNLKPGVIIYVHDIGLPSQISRKKLVELLRFWNEQYLLHAFLIGNQSFKVLFGVKYMIDSHPDLLKNIDDRCNPSGGSFWMQKVG